MNKDVMLYEFYKGANYFPHTLNGYFEETKLTTVNIDLVQRTSKVSSEYKVYKKVVKKWLWFFDDIVIKVDKKVPVSCYKNIMSDGSVVLTLVPLIKEDLNN